MADSKTTRPLTDEQWAYWQKLTSDEHDRQEAEIERLRAWLSYIDGNFRDGRECAAEALRGDAPPEGFAP